MTPEQAKEHLLEVAASGIVTRTRKYVEIQLDAETWDALQEWKRNGCAFVSETGDRVSTHWDGCGLSGPKHYECLRRAHVELLAKRTAQEPAEICKLHGCYASRHPLSQDVKDFRDSATRTERE